MHYDEEQIDERWLGGKSRSGPVDGGLGELDQNDLFDISRKDVLDRLNTYVKHVNERTYVNPATPLARIREMLSIVGLGVQIAPLSGSDGEIELPLTQWGGVLDPYTGVTEDGITGKTADGYGLNLKLEWYVNNSGRYEIDASIVSSGESIADNESFGGADAAIAAERKKRREAEEKKKQDARRKKAGRDRSPAWPK